MPSVLYGDVRLNLIDGVGVRIERTRVHPPDHRSLRRRFPHVPAVPEPLGRERQVDEAVDAIRAGVPIEFSGACGIGKSTLLRYVAATAASDLDVPGVYLQVAEGEGVGDVLQRLSLALYAVERPAKLTRDECAALLNRTRAVVAVDDVAHDSYRVIELLEVLSGCGVVLAGTAPVIDRYGNSRLLSGLPDDASAELVREGLDRPIAGHEQRALWRLIDAVEGHPLRLQQAAALVRSGEQSFASLADLAELDPTDIDRLSVDALDERERRVLAVLSFTSGSLFPCDFVAEICYVRRADAALEELCRRGLADRYEDRFGLPICRAEAYRHLVVRYLDLSRTAHAITIRLSVRERKEHSLCAAAAALELAKHAAECHEWKICARLARAAEPVLTLAGHWETCCKLLDLGCEAACAIGDEALEALFAHEHGTLALCQDDLETAERELSHAFDLRRQIGDDQGAAATNDNLDAISEPPGSPTSPEGPGPAEVSVPSGPSASEPGPSPAHPFGAHKLLRALTAMLLCLSLLFGAVRIAQLTLPHLGLPHLPSLPKVKLPHIAGPKIPWPHGPATNRTSVDVDGTATWKDTGVVVQAGKPLKITAEGSWRDGNSRVGPKGSGKPSPDNFLNRSDLGACNDCARTLTPHWDALIGYIGDAPPPPGGYTDRGIRPEAEKVFYVGDNYDKTSVPRTGKLWLNMNADAYSNHTGDNSGRVRANIEAARP